jgi:hypothetical protein
MNNINQNINVGIDNESNTIIVSTYDYTNDKYYDWDISDININGNNIDLNIFNLKYFKLNAINNFKNLIFWINIDIDNYSNVEVYNEQVF